MNELFKKKPTVKGPCSAQNKQALCTFVGTLSTSALSFVLLA